MFLPRGSVQTKLQQTGGKELVTVTYTEFEKSVDKLNTNEYKINTDTD